MLTQLPPGGTVHQERVAPIGDEEALVADQRGEGLGVQAVGEDAPHRLGDDGRDRGRRLRLAEQQVERDRRRHQAQHQGRAQEAGRIALPGERPPELRPVVDMAKRQQPDQRQVVSTMTTRASQSGSAGSSASHRPDRRRLG